eukprot:CAMPEP_0184489276 /NCGR_PEP_ID=MMETSP0113_2-20130426/14973_1 /TAXON_ID=91329 /ORGANISM="Norrisiella sphaerica, Strain BC52" /LENGTH=371 /DNA_ID=CAMNT_0026872599 /DNA_START=98 /DNA_END=1213 /DNA_ORIENTATION=-
MTKSQGWKQQESESDSGGHGPFMTKVCAWQRRNLILPLQRIQYVEPLAKILSEAPILLVSLWVIWFWCVDPSAVEFLYLVPFCEILNAILKESFGHPRPGWIQETPVEYKQFSAEYSFPSSDMMLVASTATCLFADHPGCVWALVVIIGVNRLHRGAHYLHDVIVGTVLGALLTMVYMEMEVHVMMRKAMETFSSRVTMVICWSAPIILLKYMSYLRAKRAKDPVAWEKKANMGRKHHRSLDTLEAHMKQFTGMYGLFVSLGFSSPRYDAHFPLPRNSGEFYGRVFVGLALVIGAFLLIAMIAPKKPAVAMHTFRALRYGSVPFVAACCAPVVFGYLGLLGNADSSNSVYSPQSSSSTMFAEATHVHLSTY